MDSMEGAREVNKVVKRRRQCKNKDLPMVKCVKDKKRRILVQNRATKDAWREYLDELFYGRQMSLRRHLLRSGNSIESIFKKLP